MQPNPHEVQRIIATALAEDIGTGDITGNLLIPNDSMAELAFVCREKVVVCGTEVVKAVFATLDSSLRCNIRLSDGDICNAGQSFMTVSGNARAILAGERVALNLVQRMCAIATMTSRYVEAAKGTKARILDTRKTMPGLRELDKYAVRSGGGYNHRMRLDDAILIKDNHIAVSGGITQALKAAQLGAPEGMPIEIECDTLEQVKQALAAGAHHILLDNMSLEDLRIAVALSAGKVRLEASGNMTLARIAEVAETGVDDISVGRLTHSTEAVDIGLDYR